MLQEYIHAVEEAEVRRNRLSPQIEEVLPICSTAPVVVVGHPEHRVKRVDPMRTIACPRSASQRS